MNNPIEINAFKHYLEINSVRTQILEPIGFDGSNFVCEQDKDGYGRDVYYGSTDIELDFNNEYGINEIPSGLEILLDQENINGSESDVNYILTKNGIDFNVGQLDFAGATTDNESYFKCKVIQNNEQAKIKKRSKVKVDAFATKDLDDNTITPIDTVSLLLKAKPVDKISNWSEKSLSNIQQTGTALNCQVSIPIANGLTKYGVGVSYSPFDEVFQGLDVSFAQNNAYRYANRLITAENTLTNAKLIIKNLNVQGSTNFGIFRVGYSRAIFDGNGNWVSNVGTTTNLYENTGSINIVNQTYEVDLPIMQSGESLIVDVNCFFASSGLLDFDMQFDSYSVESVQITATETGIDSVIKGVRYIDLIKQNYRAIGSLPVNAPKFDVGGQFYDQFCFSGKLIRQITNEPFYLELDKTIESLLEVNATPQINDNEIYIGQYQDFYSDVNMGTYLQLPETEAKFSKNEKYLINTFKFGYNKFEQDRDEDNTLDSIHTDSEWYLPCDNSINSKELKLPFVRDAYKIESVRRRATEKDNTSNESDDDIFIVDVIEVAPGTTRTISGTFTNFISSENNTFKILANRNFRWDLLGFKVGDTVIVGGVSFLVIDITSSILTLNWFGISYSGLSFLTITYPITDVQYTTRTNEGLTFSQNLLNADNYANLRYSIKRNMSHWFPYLATAGKFIPTKTIKNSYFKSNGEAITKFIGETANTTEKEDIAISNISSYKILSQNMYMTTLVIEFEDLLTLIGKIQTQRGYINVQDHKGNIVSGYIVSLDHTWATNECVINLEVKN
jgi:hypothetical protein